MWATQITINCTVPAPSSNSSPRVAAVITPFAEQGGEVHTERRGAMCAKSQNLQMAESDRVPTLSGTKAEEHLSPCHRDTSVVQPLM